MPISATLRPWLQLVEEGPFVRYHGRPVKDVKTAFRALRPTAGLDDQVNPYSFRHTMARELRRRRVSTEELGLLLGHLPRGQARTTSIHAPYDPDYLSGAVAMVDEVFEDLQKLMGRRIVAELMAPLRSSCDPVAIQCPFRRAGKPVGKPRSRSQKWQRPQGVTLRPLGWWARLGLNQ